MDKRVLRERMRRKKRQILIRKCIRAGLLLAGAVLVLLFVVRGIILPIANRISGGSSDTETVSEETGSETAVQSVETESLSASRVPLKGAGDSAKVQTLTPGWHQSDEGTWYQNPDGTYFADGFQEVEGVEYSFDENGYIQTGWVIKGAKEYYFKEDGAYDPSATRPMLCLTFDDGPGKYTEELLDCLEENNAHATFFMLGQNVPYYENAVKRMVEIGCELGNHSYDHTQLTTISVDAVVQQFQQTDQALINACGQSSTAGRAPYGDGNDDIYQSVGKPFFMWSLDSLDWSYMDAEKDYDVIMNGDLTDGTVILMHDIHEPSVQAALRIIPELVEKGYRLVTVSEMAAAKDVTLQNTVYVDFWDSTLAAGTVAGYAGNASDTSAQETVETDTSEENGSSDDGTYDESYDETYDEAYNESYDETYDESYDEY